MNLANEGLEARKKEDEVNAKKRKAEEDARWEGEYHIPLHGLRPVSDRDPQRTESNGWVTGGISLREVRRRRSPRSPSSAESGCRARLATHVHY